MRKTVARATGTWDTVVEIDRVTKYFDQLRPTGLFRRERSRVNALSEVSFSLKKGEFAAYAGPNGAGKSTTFKLLCGMLVPQSGQVRVFGLDPAANRIAVMQKTGVLFGNRSELWWDHPVAASFEWKKAVWDIPEATYRHMLKRVTDLLGLDEFMGSFARELSLGQRMRANLGLMLMHQPELILLDEPTLGLDVLAKRQMIDFLKALNREDGVTILVTSHDMDDLAEMADRLLLIHRGQLAFDGDYAALTRLTGDRRQLRISLPGQPPELPGARFLGQEHGQLVYEYDGSPDCVSRLLNALSALPVSDMETGRAPIESVVARLYQSWSGAQ